MKSFLQRIILRGICALILASLFYSLLWEKDIPIVTCTELPPVLGDSYLVECTARDDGSGIRSITAGIEQDGISHLLTNHLISCRGTRNQYIRFPVDINHPGIHDGRARLIVRVRDYSRSKNVGTVSAPFVIDTTPPRVTLCNTPTPLRPGGASFVAYRLDESPERCGVFVNDHYFPSFPDTVNGETLYVTCFALPIDESLNASSVIINAEDKVGNIVRLPVEIAYEPVKNRRDDIFLSDYFFTSVIPRFMATKLTAGTSPSDSFCMINETLRAKNMETVSGLCSIFSPGKFWDGPFENS